MKICYLCQDPGIPIGGQKGASAHVRGLVGAFRGAGHEVTIVTGAPAEGHDLGVPVTSVPAPLVADGLSLPAAQRRLGRALRHLWLNGAIERALGETFRTRPPDLVYERYSPFGIAGGLAARSFGIPHVLEVNAPLAREGTLYRNQALPEVATALERHALDVSGRVVAVSRELRDELVDDGADPEKISVVPNGVDPALFDPLGPLRRHAPPGAFVVGFVGSLRPWHGIDVLAQAFRELATDPRFHLLVVGDGPMACELEPLCDEFPERVALIRGVPHSEVPGYVRAMDVAVAPYAALERFYFSPLKVLEYMAAGRAVVSSGIGQLQELICHGETGWLVPPGDVGALARAVRELAHDTRRRERLGANAATEVRRAHSWDHRARQILELAPGPRAEDARAARCVRSAV